MTSFKIFFFLKLSIKTKSKKKKKINQQQCPWSRGSTIRSSFNHDESDQRSKIRKLNSWQTNSKKERYLHLGSGFDLEASEDIFFEDEVPLTWVMLTKPTRKNEIKPPFHFPLTLRNTHFEKSSKTTPWFLKIAFCNVSLTKRNNKKKTLIVFFLWVQWNIEIWKCKWKWGLAQKRERKEGLLSIEEEEEEGFSDPTKGNQRIKKEMAAAMIFVVVCSLLFLSSRFNDN